MSPSASQSPSASVSPSHSTSPSSSASPSAPASPSAIANIWEWWEPELEGLGNGASIGTLTGQVSPGSGHNWTQGTGSLKPTFVTGVINGLGVARWDGTDDEMANVDPTALTAVHLFAVVKMDSNTPAAGKSGLWSFGTVGNSYPLNSPNTDITNDSFRNSSLQFSKSGIDVAQWRVIEIISTATEWTFKLDGTQLHTTGTTTFTHQAAGFIRLGRDGPFGGNYLDGDLAGMYIFSAKLTTTRADIIGYINNRFGLSSS